MQPNKDWLNGFILGINTVNLTSIGVGRVNMVQGCTEKYDLCILSLPFIGCVKEAIEESSPVQAVSYWRQFCEFDMLSGRNKLK